MQRKERTLWPWLLLGIVVLALLIWWLVARDSNNGATSYGATGDTTAALLSTPGAYVAAPNTTAAPARGAATATAAYMAYDDSTRARSAMGVDHVYTANGIRRLADALDAIATGNAANGHSYRTRLDSARTLADALEREPSSTRHASYARAAFLQEAEIMSSIEPQRLPNASKQVDAVRSAAEAVSPQQALLQQKSEVQEFFDRAATALRTMSNGKGS